MNGPSRRYSRIFPILLLLLITTRKVDLICADVEQHTRFIKWKRLVAK